MKKFYHYFILIAILALQIDMKGQTTDPNVPIFEVKNQLGQTVFAVYPGGVKIFIDDQFKATGGGFTVGRLSTGKSGSAEDYFWVNPGNVHVNLPGDIRGTKATGGGFTVGRLSTGKSSGESVNYLTVTPDSTRINVSDSVKGFAIANIQEGVEQDFMDLNKQNYLIGHQTGTRLASGIYNSMFGYQAGYNTKTGNNSLFLGYMSGYSNISGNNNVFLGTKSGYTSEKTSENTFVGYRSGYLVKGANNSLFGSVAGENAKGENNTYIGTEAGRMAIGSNNTYFGKAAGYGMYAETYSVEGNTEESTLKRGDKAEGSNNVMLGYKAGFYNYSAANNTLVGSEAGMNVNNGVGNVFLGFQAGANAYGAKNRLFIANSNTESPLVYGEFDNQRINLNADVTAYSYTEASDLRLKTNLITVSSALDIVNALNAYYFDWNDNAKNTLGFPDKKQLGFVAQEVEAVVPEIVTTTSTGYKAVDYSKMTPILLEAIKEQNKMIQNLQQRVEKLEALNDKLTSTQKETEQLKADIEALKALILEKTEK